MKPTRAWKVGDRTFDTYEEARSFSTRNSAQLRRAEIIDCLREALNNCPYGKADEDSAEALVDHLLKIFDIRPKRKRTGSPS